MKPPKELNLPYPKALKGAEAAMVAAEAQYDEFMERIQNYRTRVEELRTERLVPQQEGISKTAQGLLDDPTEARKHYERVSYAEHELTRFEGTLKELDTGPNKEAAYTARRAAQEEAEQQWRLYWQSVQEAATDHIIEAVGVYFTEATDAHWRSANGRIGDWLLDVLAPRIEELEQNRKTFQYPVASEKPVTQAQTDEQATQLAQSQEAESRVDEQRRRNQELWELNYERSRKMLGPVTTEQRKELLGW